MYIAEMLVEAISRGSLNEVERCLRCSRTDINEFVPSGMTNPLMAAVYRGDVEMVEFLSSNGARVDVGDRNGRTALMVAIDQNNLAMFNLLLQRGADINAVSVDGLNVLDLACKTQRRQMARLLKDRGARRHQGAS